MLVDLFQGPVPSAEHLLGNHGGGGQQHFPSRSAGDRFRILRLEGAAQGFADVLSQLPDPVFQFRTGGIDVMGGGQLQFQFIGQIGILDDEGLDHLALFQGEEDLLGDFRGSCGLFALNQYHQLGSFNGSGNICAEILSGSDLFRADPAGNSVPIGQMVDNGIRGSLIGKGKTDKNVMAGVLFHVAASSAWYHNQYNRKGGICKRLPYMRCMRTKAISRCQSERLKKCCPLRR